MERANNSSDMLSESEKQQGLAIVSENEFEITRVAVSQPKQNRTTHYHERYELYYLYSGDRYYFINDKTYHVKSGDAVLIKPYDIHITNNYSKSGYDRCLIMFKRSFVRELESTLGMDGITKCLDGGAELFHLSFQEQSLIETLLAMMLGEYKVRQDGYEALMRSSLATILLILSRHEKDGAEREEGGISTTHKTVSAVAAYIINNCSEDITLESISERFYISPCYFSRVFKRVMGVSFSEYLNGIRIKEAQRLLAKTELSILEVTQATGYKSTTHFGRCFKGITGMSPNEYRRTKRKI
ncbi:MAG: helix-turn-helix domain-containing protein [Clostridia bacterium]|nr:helix-turn-helix domain-containing protein [Clostridia bacterium]